MPFLRLSQDYEVVFIREGEQVVIPCLGSLEDLNVTLFTVGKMMMVIILLFGPHLFASLIILSYDFMASFLGT